jgi:uncharacterized protein (TIGR02453 family)
MLHQGTIDFLKELSGNNNKEWFDDNRQRYQEIRKNLVIFSEALILVLQEIDSEIKGQLPKNCIFRINRDTRFSKDKTPYKTNFGIEISKDGRRSKYASYYMHIEPNNSFAGGGIYMPEPTVTNIVRQSIYNYSKEFFSILSDEDFISEFGNLEEFGKLKNPPKGFPKDWKHIEVLKHKSFVVGKHFTDEDISSQGFFDKVVHAFEKLNPLVSFINTAIDEYK